MRRLRNCNVTTVAPTGTISIIAGCSSGIEPLFAVAFMRNQAGVLMPDVNEDFVAIAKAEGWYSDELMRKIAETGHIDFPEVPAKWQRVFVTANAIKPEWHIRMQAAFQEYNDSAISKTCNFAHDATEEYVEEIYRLAYRLNCKGVTVYRDGSREMQVLSTGSTAKKVRRGTAETGRAGKTGRKGRRRWQQPICMGRSPSCGRRTIGCSASSTSWSPKIFSGGRSAPVPRCCAAPPAGWRRRSARCTSPSPRTTGVSRSRSS